MNAGTGHAAPPAGRGARHRPLSELRRLRQEHARLRSQLAELGRLIAALLDVIDHETELRIRCSWYGDGWRAAELAHADDYERGFVDGCMAVKRAQHDAHRLVELETARWGGLREDFGKLRHGDFPGRGEAA